ncbi:MAG: DUF1801 domain-containing protein [Sphingomonadales bacterium]
MKSDAATPEDYIASLPFDRAKAIAAVREVILDNLPRGYEEVINWGMITYQVPLKTYPDTYNKKPLMYAALASEKNYMVVHFMCLYTNADLKQKFEAAYKAAGRKLNMGKSCVRFKKLENLPLELIGEIVASTPVDQFIGISKKAHGK